MFLLQFHVFYTTNNLVPFCKIIGISRKLFLVWLLLKKCNREKLHWNAVTIFKFQSQLYLQFFVQTRTRSETTLDFDRIASYGISGCGVFKAGIQN